jgi:hypothetical protein
LIERYHLDSLKMKPHPVDREQAILHDLIHQANERAAAETRVRSAFQSRTEAAEQAYQEGQQRIGAEYQAAKKAAEHEHATVRQGIAERFAADMDAAEKVFTKNRSRIAGQFFKEKEALETECQESCWTANALLEGNKTKADGQWQEFKSKMSAQRERIDAIRQEATQRLGAWLAEPRDNSLLVEVNAQASEDELRGRLKEQMAAADALLLQTHKLFLLKVLPRSPFLGLAAGLWLLLILPAAWTAAWYYWLIGGTLATAALAAGARVWLSALARTQVARIHDPLNQALAEAEALDQAYQTLMEAAYQRQLARNQECHTTSVREAEEKRQRRLDEISERRERDTAQNEESYQRLQGDYARRRDQDTQETDDKRKRRLAEIQHRFDTETVEVDARYRRQTQDSTAQHEAEWNAMVQNWREGLAAAHAGVTEINQESQRLFPPWTDPCWSDWQPASVVPPVIRFGEFQIGLDQIPNGIPQEEALKNLGPDRYTLPALLACPDRCSMLFKASDRGRSRAEESLQLVMLRLLTALPAGKVRFTIIDPVGLGRNFAAFMHLADHDEALVTSRIWTEQPHIEQRLADLTAHMENVIQKFLRNQFQTISEYNAHAGEVAEPFRFLVVANFPVNFSPEAGRRLASIAASGARCGVHALITVDTKQPLPTGFDLADLERHSVNLVWKENGFVWKDPDFAPFPFRLDAPPDADFTTPLLQVVGQKAREASRVEVPFDFIAPASEQWWTRESRTGIDVALGRSGATKRQHLLLGQGTAQHVLIAGKTGSGKSTLLHALITNLSLLYSPDEVELYLVDFKEGVEFKPYATFELPHARVVAIESEREFGLSVLQRLEGELKNRGDKFRALGVQDLNNYRVANGQTPLPRILLIVDEFQLFFIEDDKIAQDAALLLDRLVRQGRAFGIHVLLGSQTLGGAYSLARSTIGQMAVRIALQCSESDAHLILSDDNPAARLLSRPGEAIYNDANGLVEGNDFFQVVWLSDDMREDYLRRIGDLARQRHHVAPRPQIVFEGKAPADVSKNYLLTELLQDTAWRPAPRAVSAWLGEALAIKDPTAAVFRPQSGGNLMMVGQFDESALSIFTIALIGLAAQHPPTGGTRFYVLDGTPVDSPHVGFLAKLAEVVPHPVNVAGWREASSLLTEVAEEVERRQQVQEGESPNLYVFVYGLQRFRDLRRSEDDFGFSRRAENAPPNPSRLFSSILREGPAVGVYTLVWCDTLNNVSRALDRQGLKEFEMRVLFQMSAADSSNLIDTPMASKLGLHRALFYSEDRGQPEKFRPYGLPSPDWLAWVKERFSSKVACQVGPSLTNS